MAAERRLTKDLFTPHREWTLVLLPVLLASSVLLGVLCTHQVSIVEGVSMKPTLHSDDRLLLSRGCDRPRRQEIVVFQEGGRFDGGTLVKRVVAVPGDVVMVVGDQVLVNGVPEPPHGMRLSSADGVSAQLTIVPSGHVYVMGDNRPTALDSRLIGPVKISAIKGRVVAILGPIGRMRLTGPSNP